MRQQQMTRRMILMTMMMMTGMHKMMVKQLVLQGVNKVDTTMLHQMSQQMSCHQCLIWM